MLKVANQNPGLAAGSCSLPLPGTVVVTVVGTQEFGNRNLIVTL